MSSSTATKSRRSSGIVSKGSVNPGASEPSSSSLLLEPIRLLLGYVGNLSERVAWLMPFWVLTIFPQLLVHIYFVFIQDLIAWVVLPIEQVLSVAFIVLYLFELGVGYGTARRLVSKATADYQLALNEGELVT